MIDWAGVCTNALWIVGLAVVLTALSHARWLAGERGLRYRAVWGAPAYQVAFDLGLALVSAGLFFSARSTWERLCWGAFALLYTALGWVEWRRKSGGTNPAHVMRPAVEAEAGSAGGILAWFTETVQRGEPWLILAVVPLLLFPGRHSPWALVVIALVWGCRWLSRGRLSVRTPSDWGIIGMLLMSGIGFWVSVDPSLARAALYQVLAGVAIYYGVTNWADSGGRLWVATAGLLALGGAVALGGVLTVGTIRHKLFDVPQVMGRVRLPLGETVNPNVLAGGLCLILPVALSLALFAKFDRQSPERARLVRALLILDALAMLVAAVLLQSRGAWLALGLGLPLVVTLGSRWRKALLVALIVAIVILLNRVPLDQVLEAISTGGAINGWDKREEIWSRALYMIQDFSYTGIGLGTFGVVGPVLYPYFLIGPDAHIPHAHNLFLQVAVDLGLPGLISFLSLYGGSLWLAWTGCQRARSWGRADEKALFLGLFAGLVAMGLHGMVDAVTWGIVKPAIVPWWVMGLVAAATRVLPCSREEGGEQGKTEDFTGVTGG